MLKGQLVRKEVQAELEDRENKQEENLGWRKKKKKEKKMPGSSHLDMEEAGKQGMQNERKGKSHSGKLR